ncbi:hypothetical protein [Bradyrhizobium sp. LHD-71]|uniref:hypothetical protein n=1 Tax=Bradyrhizobium sp. LHD-71 TaxID=3072141 RepID=UPI00280C8E07|nr:hypothetical protein [Bradyrhizobium sp. LHD-71]MDQ8726318.1 hypothetical protein [Bradyrhizobium sp. LHD-71]
MSAAMDDARTRTVTRPAVQWAAVFAGALAAAALAVVLHSFAAAIGLAVSSTAPTWRDGSTALWILSGIYLVLVALGSYGLGGYVAGWIRSWSSVDDGDAADTTNGIHGLLVWALATLITLLMIGATVLAASQLAAPSGGNTGPGVSAGSENLIAYDVDRLFRADGRAPQGDVARVRSEAGRILLTASGHSGVSSEDRQYLIRLVSAQTGLAAPEAERRVDATIERARDNIRRARRSAVIVAFMAGAAALLGAAAAWFAAGIGARHGRDPTANSIWSERLSWR